MKEREVQPSAVPQPGQRKNMDPVKGSSSSVPGRFANDCIASGNNGGFVAGIRNAYSGDTKLFFYCIWDGLADSDPVFGADVGFYCCILGNVVLLCNVLLIVWFSFVVAVDDDRCLLVTAPRA